MTRQQLERELRGEVLGRWLDSPRREYATARAALVEATQALVEDGLLHRHAIAEAHRCRMMVSIEASTSVMHCDIEAVLDWETP